MDVPVGGCLGSWHYGSLAMTHAFTAHFIAVDKSYLAVTYILFVFCLFYFLFCMLCIGSVLSRDLLTAICFSAIRG